MYLNPDYLKKNTGFTLIEVLISLLILAVGLLGLAGMQARGLRSNLSAYNRSQATQLAYEMADRMRANLTDARLYGGSIYNTVLAVNANLQAGCTAVAGACTPIQMARNDLAEWNLSLTNNSILPNGRGLIRIPPAPAAPNIYIITINWDDNRDGCVNPADALAFVGTCAALPASADDPNFTMSFQL